MNSPRRKRFSIPRGKSRTRRTWSGNAMLDLFAVKTQIDAMVEDERAIQERFQEKLALALREFRRWGPEWERLARKIEKSRERYGGDDAAEAIKHLHVWCTEAVGRHSVPLRDYYRMDLDELVSDYYKPRVAKYVEVLARKLASGETTLTDDELDAMYEPIEEAFIVAPLRSMPEGEDPVAIVRAFIAADSD